MSQILNEIKQDLYGMKKPVENKTKKHTIMEMVFNDQSMVDPDEIDNPGYDAAPDSFEPMDDNEAQQKQAAYNDPEIQDMISNIRVSVLDGLRKLAKHPESPQYDMLKKVYNIIDKTVETQQMR